MAAEPGIMNDDFIQIGMRDGYGGQIPFGISLPGLRHHVYVIGTTGAGKTTLLRNMMLQLIAAGHGVGFIDPHGDEAQNLLDFIPTERIDDAVYFNPSDVEFPVALNLLANVPKDQRALVASDIVGAFKSIWRDSWGPRMEYILYNAIAALLDCQNTSLLGVNRLLIDENYRAWVIRQIKDPFIREFWEYEYAGYDERFQREAIAPIQNKLGQFLLNPVIRNILGQVECKLSFPSIMDKGRIFVANLSKGKIGHNQANLLGSLLVTQFQLAAMRRAEQPENERRDFFLFIDEFFNFTTDAFASILSEVRKYRLCLILSHQYVDQLPLPIRQAVFGNVGTIISFRVGSFDADVLQSGFANAFIGQQFVDLERFNVFAKVLGDGANSVPFQGVTLHSGHKRVGQRIAHITNSRRKFAVPRAKVEAALNRAAISNSDTSQQRPRNRHSASPLSAPKSSAGSATKRTRRYPGVVLPI